MENTPLIVLVGYGDTQRVLSCRWYIKDPSIGIYKPENIEFDDDVNGILVRIEEVREEVGPNAVRWYGYCRITDKRSLEGLRALLLTCPAFGLRQAAEHIRFMPGGEGAEEARADFERRVRPRGTE